MNQPFSPANIYPSSFWLLCFIPTFITKTPTIPYQDAHYSLSKQGTSPYLSLAINYQLKIKRFLLSHLTLLFSTQSTFRERRFTIHLKYFLQIYPLKFGGFKKKQYLCTRLRKPSYSHPDRIWRDGRVVDYNGLENRRTERYRGFESLSLRKSLLKEISEGFFFYIIFPDF